MIGLSLGRIARKGYLAPRQSDTAPVLRAPQHEVSVVVDENRNISYRFLDAQTGELVQPVPPEELLRVMHNIGEWLQESQQELKVTA